MALSMNFKLILAMVSKIEYITMYKKNTKNHLRTLIYVLGIMCFVFKES